MEPSQLYSRLLPQGMSLNLEAAVAYDIVDRKNVKPSSTRGGMRSHRGSETSANNPVLSFQNQERSHSLTNKAKGYQPFFRLKKKAYCIDNKAENLQKPVAPEVPKNKKAWPRSIETDNLQGSDVSDCYQFLRLSNPNQFDPFSPEDHRIKSNQNSPEKGKKRPLNERALPKATPKKPLRPSDTPKVPVYDEIPLKIYQPGYNQKNGEWSTVISPQRLMTAAGSGRHRYFSRNGNNNEFLNLKKAYEIKCEGNMIAGKMMNQDVITDLINDIKNAQNQRHKKSVSNGPQPRTTHDDALDDKGERNSTYTTYNTFKNTSTFTKQRDTHTAGGYERAAVHGSIQRSLTNDLEGTPVDKSTYLRISGLQKKLDQKPLIQTGQEAPVDKYSNWLFDRFCSRDMKLHEKNLLQCSPDSKDVILSQQQISLIFSHMKELTLQQQNMQIIDSKFKPSDEEPSGITQNEEISVVGQNANIAPVKNNQGLRQSRKFQIKTQVPQPVVKEKKDEQILLFTKQLELYQDFMLRINFTFNVIVKPPTDKTYVCYKYYLGQGNNNQLIRSLMKQRWWWSQSDRETGNVNFAWTQIKMNHFIDLMKPRYKSAEENVEKIWSAQKSSTFAITAVDSSYSDSSESDSELDAKKKVIRRHFGRAMSAQAQGAGGSLSEKEDAIDRQKIEEKGTGHPLDRLMTQNELALMKTRLSNRVTAEDLEELCRMKQGSTCQTITDPTTLKMCNHLENNFHLGNKKALLWNMRSYYESLKDNVFNYLPLTFHVQTGLEDLEFLRFTELYEKREKEASELPEDERKTMTKGRNIWIVKPGEDTNRGRGINVCSNINEIKDIIGGGEAPVDGPIKRTYLIQEYLINPLLYNKRKFDIRCYFLISCINGIYKGYWYEEGYIRTTSREFNLKNLHNKQVHLTNDAIQKKFDGYGKFEYGNKVSFADFHKYLESQYNGRVSFYNDIYPKIRALSIDAIKAVYGKVDPLRRDHCFEVFGLDFMIDTDLKAWLIEINTNPDITTTSPVLTKIIPPMVENALRLTLDPMFPPPCWPNGKKPLIPENLSENNKFELVFDEVEDASSLKHIANLNNEATMGLIFEMENEQEEDNGQ